MSGFYFPGFEIEIVIARLFGSTELIDTRPRRRRFNRFTVDSCTKSLNDFDNTSISYCIQDVRESREYLKIAKTLRTVKNLKHVLYSRFTLYW